MKNMLKKAASLVMTAVMLTSMSFSAYADKKAENSVKAQVSISAEGENENWDGVSNVAQFIDSEGRFCFAYDGRDDVTIIRTNKDGKALKKRVTLRKKHPLFGTVVCDKSGNFYLVTGETNSGNNADKQTIFVSKYNSKGKHIATVGDNGRASLAYYYDDSFATKVPFDAGNCSAALNGDILAVNYARKMYNGHQSNSVFKVNIKTMSKVSGLVEYNSHSFAQRTVPYKDGFLYASEGDCYPRAFTLTYDSGKTASQYELFHFWVKNGTLDSYDMYVLNDNFAHMGGLAVLGDSRAALVGTSVKSLSSKAEKESEQLFVQIFDPSKSLNSSSSFITSGKRSGLGGPNGDTQVTDYGVKWLTNFTGKTKISNPQAAAVGDKLVVLYEKTVGYEYGGVYYIVIDKNGKVLKKSQKFSSKAHLNPCTMPVVSGKQIYWAGNRTGEKNVYVYSIKID